ncbi:MAG: hypothetical protein FWG34_06980 [Oscillospiraceae bacterium]|nr:hypothetical protein [Oscillospiraceae bacterium]
MSCNGKNKIEFNIEPFSYAEDIDYLERQNEYRVDPSKFKNTTETKIKTKEDVIELAKNEIIWEYTLIDVYYDKTESIWAILFSFDYSYGQRIYIDDKGVTKLIAYVFRPHDDVVVPYSCDDYEFYGGIKKKDSNEFKNIMETEVKTKEDVIELAKNELINGYEYDRIFVSYDGSTSMWGIIFWTDEEPYGGQYVYIDGKGITQKIIIIHSIFNDYIEYSKFLEKQGGIKRDSNEFKNTTKPEINWDNLRETIIELAKIELSEGYEYSEVAVYGDFINFIFMVSFWEDETTTKGQHIFINNDGITKMIIDIE